MQPAERARPLARRAEAAARDGATAVRSCSAHDMNGTRGQRPGALCEQALGGTVGVTFQRIRRRGPVPRSAARTAASTDMRGCASGGGGGGEFGGRSGGAGAPATGGGGGRPPPPPPASTRRRRSRRRDPGPTRDVAEAVARARRGRELWASTPSPPPPRRRRRRLRLSCRSPALSAGSIRCSVLAVRAGTRAGTRAGARAGARADGSVGEPAAAAAIAEALEARTAALTAPRRRLLWRWSSFQRRRGVCHLLNFQRRRRWLAPPRAVSGGGSRTGGGGGGAGHGRQACVAA